jgi:hypothetical protein
MILPGHSFTSPSVFFVKWLITLQSRGAQFLFSMTEWVFRSTKAWRFWIVETQFQNSTFYGIKWIDSRPGRFTPTGRSHVSHWIGGWVALSRSGHCGGEKSILPLRAIEPSLYPITSHYTDWYIRLSLYNIYNWKVSHCQIIIAQNKWHFLTEGMNRKQWSVCVAQFSFVSFNVILFLSPIDGICCWIFIGCQLLTKVCPVIETSFF